MGGYPTETGVEPGGAPQVQEGHGQALGPPRTAVLLCSPGLSQLPPGEEGHVYTGPPKMLPEPLRTEPTSVP